MLVATSLYTKEAFIRQRTPVNIAAQPFRAEGALKQSSHKGCGLHFVNRYTTPDV